MTHEQITARCKQFLFEECHGRFPAASIIESLYREAIAVGIEIACHAIRTEFLATLTECEKEAGILRLVDETAGEVQR